MSTPSSVSVLPLTPAHAEAYVALRREMLLDSPRSFGASPGQDKGSDVEHMRTALGQPEFAVIGAFEGMAGAGGMGELGTRGEHSPKLVAVAAVLREAPIKRRHIAKIWGVYVTPSARGRGLAKRVVQGAIEAARSWGDANAGGGQVGTRGVGEMGGAGVRVEQVQLSVSETAPVARAVYESLGFVTWGIEPDALRVVGDVRGAAERHMVLVLR